LQAGQNRQVRFSQFGELFSLRQRWNYTSRNFHPQVINVALFIAIIVNKTLLHSPTTLRGIGQIWEIAISILSLFCFD